MASRFFHGSDSSSESSEEEELYGKDESEESEEESDEESEEDDSDDDSSSDDEGAATGVNRFLKKDAMLKSDDEDSEEEDKVTVVKSAKDKRFEELEATIKLIDNAKKINDWAVISTEYDKLNRLLPNLVKQNDGKPPKLYIQAIADLETLMLETYEKQKVTPKKMSGPNTKGLNAVRQRIRKNNREFNSDIEQYRADKDEFMKEDVVEEVVVAPRRPRRTVEDIEQSMAAADDAGFTTVGAGGKAVQYTPESILKHLRSIMEARGRKNTDRLDQIRIMERLLEVATTDYQRIRVLLTIIPTRFDLTSGTGSQMTQEQWKSAEQEFASLLKTLDANHNILVVEGAEEWEDDDKQPTLTSGELFKVPGSIVSFVERLDDELTRSLQHIDPHTAEYVDRLRDEGSLYTNIVRALLYAERMNANDKIPDTLDATNRTVIRRLEHVYFKPAQVVAILEENTWKAIPGAQDSKITPRKDTDTSKLVQTLSTYLFGHSDGIIRARAMLCQVYFLALHDHYYQARDMMLMSHLQENINSFDVPTQILFNRTLVQVGLCAFRAGLVSEAQTSLQEICGSNRQKELLAQGLQLQRYSQISPEQEKVERQRQLPFHMHINLELLECVYLTCSMLLEIPLLAQTGTSHETRKRVISKTFRRLLEYNERQLFTGPPENTRDHIMKASKELDKGEWKLASEYINSIKIWELMAQSEKIKTMLAQHIQEVGVRTYLFQYAPYYDTLSLAFLSSTFELDERKITAIVSKMISHEELAAALDQVNGAIIFRKGVKLSRLQTQALTLADKASGLIESNEKVLEQRTQGTANAFERQRGGDRGGRGGGQRGGRGGGGGGGGGARRGGGQRTNFTGGALGRIGVQT